MQLRTFSSHAPISSSVFLTRVEDLNRPFFLKLVHTLFPRSAEHRTKTRSLRLEAWFALPSCTRVSLRVPFFCCYLFTAFSLASRSAGEKRLHVSRSLNIFFIDNEYIVLIVSLSLSTQQIMHTRSRTSQNISVDSFLFCGVPTQSCVSLPLIVGHSTFPQIDLARY